MTKHIYSWTVILGLGFAQLGSASVFQYKWSQLTNPELTGNWENASVTDFYISDSGEKVLYGVQNFDQSTGHGQHPTRYYVSPLDPKNQSKPKRIDADYASDAIFSPNARYVAFCGLGTFVGTQPVAPLYVLDTEAMPFQSRKVADISSLNCPGRDSQSSDNPWWSIEPAFFTPDSRYFAYLTFNSEVSPQSWQNETDRMLMVIDLQSASWPSSQTVVPSSDQISRDHQWLILIGRDKRITLQRIGAETRHLDFTDVSSAGFSGDSRYLFVEGTQQGPVFGSGIFAYDLLVPSQPSLLLDGDTALKSWWPAGAQSIFAVTATRLISFSVAAPVPRTLRHFASDGEARRFVNNDVRMIVSPDGSYAVLTGAPDGTTTWFDQNGDLKTFNQSCDLGRFEANGAFAYSSQSMGSAFLWKDGSLLSISENATDPMLSDGWEFLGTSLEQDAYYWRNSSFDYVVLGPKEQAGPQSTTIEARWGLKPVPHTQNLLRAVEVPRTDLPPAGHESRWARIVLQLGERLR